MPPDKEVGFLGEKFIYEQEVSYAIKNGIPVSEVEWVSQSDPQSPYDIKSVRITPNGKQEYFIEVKSSRSMNESNIYISSRQVKFFQENESNSLLKFVTFISNTQVDTVQEYSLKQLMNEFELSPIKFKLKKLKQ
ncbi:protein NO VEIN domain-containing protein [Enterobacter roggenkampii]|uniref:protein NO VEIN domain-containing protein n=1 Tax=Enterobacter roggenkampii TaxID=1812935 RepID=UPI003A9303D1